MGWTNSHLHQFIQYGIFYSEPQEEMWDDMDAENYTDLRVSDLLTREKDTLIYTNMILEMAGGIRLHWKRLCPRLVKLNSRYA